MVVKRDEWRGAVRHVHEIAELRDVSVVTTGAYPATAATAEFRSAPIPDPEPAAPASETTEDGRMADEQTETTPTTGTLTVEDRGEQTAGGATAEARVLSAMASVPKGEARDLTHATAEPVEPDDLRTVLIDRLRENAAVVAAGAIVVPTDRKAVKWPVLTGDVTAAFYDELEEITPSDVDLDEFEIPVKAIKALVRGSSEAFEDSRPRPTPARRRQPQRDARAEGRPRADDRQRRQGLQGPDAARSARSRSTSPAR